MEPKCCSAFGTSPSFPQIAGVGKRTSAKPSPWKHRTRCSRLGTLTSCRTEIGGRQISCLPGQGLNFNPVSFFLSALLVVERKNVPSVFLLKVGLTLTALAALAAHSFHAVTTKKKNPTSFLCVLAAARVGAGSDNARMCLCISVQQCTLGISPTAAW